MKEWIISVGAVLLLTSCIMLILPEGKTAKIIKPIFTVVVLLVIIKPLTLLTDFDFSYDDNLDDKFSIQNSYIDYSLEKRIELYEENSIKIISDLGVENADFSLLWGKASDYDLIINKAQIDLSKAVYTEDFEHIDITKEIKKSISNYLNIDLKDVEVYG